MKKKGLLITLILLLVLVVLFIFAFSPLRDRNAELKTNVADLQAELAQKQEQVTPEQTEVEVGEIDQRILEIAIPNRFDQDDMIEQLSNLANNNNMKIENISFGRGTTESQFINNVQVALNVSGGLFSFLEFLYDLEAQERFYNLSNFTLTIGETEPRQVNFSVSMEVYHS